MSEEQGGEAREDAAAQWVAVADAWQRVGAQLRYLGEDIAETFRRSYDETGAGDAPDSEIGPADRLTDAAGTIERSLKAARATVDAPDLRATAGLRARTLSDGIEHALSLSLEEMGRALIKLSDDMGRRGADDRSGEAGEPEV